MSVNVESRGPIRHILDMLGQAWVIAGGFGGLAGIVVLTVLEGLGRLSTIYAEVGRFVIACGILWRKRPSKTSPLPKGRYSALS